MTKRRILILLTAAVLAGVWWIQQTRHHTSPQDGSATTTPSPSGTQLPTMTMPPTTPMPTPTRTPGSASPSMLVSFSPTPVAQVTVTPNASPAGLPTRWDQSTPDAAAAAFVTRFYTVDSAVDQTPGAGPARAAAVATPRLAGELVMVPGTGRSGAEWAALVKHAGHQTVTASAANLGDPPADTGGTALRTIKAHIVAQGSQGWHAERSVLMNITMKHSHGLWLVDSYQIVV